MKLFNKKLLLFVAVLIAAFTQLHTQPNVPTLTIDTLVNLSKTSWGDAGGAYFLPDGNIIAMWKSTPHIIDANTGEVLRKLDTTHSSIFYSPKLSKDGTKFATLIEGQKLKVWDVPSGKLIFEPEKPISYFCLSPDGTRLYVTLPNNADNPGIIVIYDMANFLEIERLSYASLNWAREFDISPDGQTLALSVLKKTSNPYDKRINPVVLINLNDKKNYTIVDTLEFGVKSMEFSPDGKQIAFLFYGHAFDEVYIGIYNIETKKKNYIRMAEQSTFFEYKATQMGYPKFVDNNTILVQISSEMDENIYYLSWNILENKVKNYVNLVYNQSIDVKDNIVLFCNYVGVIGYINKDIVSVKNKIQKEVLLAYINHQLEYFSDAAFVGESMVYDISGKLIADIGSQTFLVGKNIIRINSALPHGIYILTIKSATEQTSFKFLVE